MAVIVALVAIHKFWSAPAAAVVGTRSPLMITTSPVDKQPGLEMFQSKLTELPGVMPDIVVVGDSGLAIVAEPERIDQVPVPVLGVFAASVAVVVPQII